jgi:glycosyltransferase involved in cell wall biosynthesis
MQFTNITAHNEPAHDTAPDQIEAPRVKAPLPPQFDQCCHPIGEPRMPGFRYCAAPVAQPGAVRLLHVTEAPRGGVLTYLFNLIEAQVVSSEIELVHVLGPSVNEPVLRQCRSPKLRVDSIRYERRSWRTLLRLGVATLRAVRQVRPDIVHIHSSLAGVIVRICLLPVRRRPKLIYTPHAWSFSPGATRNVWFRRTCERVLALWTHRIICVSEDEMRLALDAGISQARCAVVLTGISSHAAVTTAVLGPEPRRRRRVLFVGRFDYQKGFDIYLEVMRLLGERAEGIVAGSPIVSKPMDIPIPPNVRTLGWCSPDQVLALYREADLLLMPSRFEGLPMVALEAMQAGVPIFASNAGPMREVVEDGVSGRLFPGAPPDQIAAEIASTSDEQLRRFGQAGRDIFQRRFTAERMSRDMLEAYRAVLGESGASNSPVEARWCSMMDSTVRPRATI